jgi:hypothetical protein
MICGIADTSSCELKLPAIMDTLVSSPEHSLLFRRFQIDSLLIINDKYLLDRKYKPAVKWFADGGIVNNEPRYLYQNFGVSAGMSMTLPVFDGNQRKLSYDKIRIHEDTRKSYQENFLLQYRSGLQQLQVELSKTRMLMKENEKQVALVNELLAADNSLLDSGQISITDYILAMKNLVEAKHAGLLYQIRAQYVLNEINFRKQ